LTLACLLRTHRLMTAELNRSIGRRHTADGFTLIETMVVVAVGIILAAAAIPVSSAFISATRADSSVVATVDALTTARDRSVAERRNFVVTFTPPNHIIVQRQEQPSLTLTPISDTVLENGQQFVVFPAIADTPDLFGHATALAFTGTGPWMFTSDGSFNDSNGDPANGTVFLGVPNQTSSARAVTIFGATGLMRQWKWRGAQWFN
jgi:prepilin-type N-terminal cleavage/methylation domain-containing protein